MLPSIPPLNNNVQLGIAKTCCVTYTDELKTHSSVYLHSRWTSLHSSFLGANRVVVVLMLLIHWKTLINPNCCFPLRKSDHS